MKNEKCYLIKDLLPSYIDEICTEETNEIIKKHLEECPDCKKSYNLMKGDIPGEREFKNTVEYDRELLQKVGRDVKRKNDKSRKTTAIIVAAILLLFIFINLPIVPVNSRNLSAKVIKPAVMLEKAAYKYNEVPENSVLLYNDETVYDIKKSKDSPTGLVMVEGVAGLEDMFFHRVIFTDGSTEKDGIVYYATRDVDLMTLSFVEIESNKPIRRYNTKTEWVNGSDALVVKSVKTSILGSFQNKKELKSMITVVNNDGIDKVYVKNGQSFVAINAD